MVNLFTHAESVLVLSEKGEHLCIRPFPLSKGPQDGTLSSFYKAKKNHPAFSGKFMAKTFSDEHLYLMRNS